MATRFQKGAFYDAGTALPRIHSIVHQRDSARPEISGRICHSCWTLDFAFTACGLYRVGRVRSPWQLRRADTAHLYAPGTPYWEDMTRGPMESGFITFSPVDDAELKRLTGPGRGCCCLTDPENLLRLLLEQAADAAQAGQSLKAQARVLEILDLVLHSDPLKDSPAQRRIGAETGKAAMPAFSGRIREYLTAHIQESVSLDSLAKRFHASPSSVSHRFREESGISPMRELMRIRIEAVKRLLYRGEPLKRIAPETGFCDEYHLSRAFKAATGISPKRYLKNSGG